MPDGTRTVVPVEEDRESNAVASGNLFGAKGPRGVLKRATEISTVLAPVLEGGEGRKPMYTTIGNGRHVNVEGWVTLGNMVGVFPQIEWTKPIKDGDGTMIGWEARCLAVTIHGNVVSAGESMCMTDERNWEDKPMHALRSMAQTRATSKALATALRFIVQLAGYETAPAEEMDGVRKTEGPVRSKPKTARAKPKKTEAPPVADNEPTRVTVLRMAKKSGTTNDKNWTRHGVFVKDDSGVEFWVNTFDTELAEAASFCKDSNCKANITVEHTDRGTNLIDIDVLEDEDA